nr:putative uncharacterized protein DDB_G0287457 [Helicoverpa armigera]
MINVLSYVGMNMQSEVCLWCLLGLVRTIFDATLFKVNANLKQVWQMTMPAELTMPVQRVLRTMISGVMLVQCFTVYVYLASYIVLLYPVFLEERPTLVLPWLLLAAIRKLLCELTSLALGLGTCVLLGPARPPCIKFVVFKFTSIMPAFYMWMLVFSYYHALKVATAFKTFPAVLPPNDNDYGLELAVRRRRTKSLLGEEQLRKKLVAHFNGERTSSVTNETFIRTPLKISSGIINSTDTSIEEEGLESDTMKPLTISTTGWSDIGAYEDWFGSEVMIPRDTDRILEQIVLMLLRIGAYLKKEGIESILDSHKLSSAVPPSWHQFDNIECTTMNADDTDTPPLVGSSKGNMASYLREYPQIFMKKINSDNPPTELTIASLKNVHSHGETDDGIASKNKVQRISSGTSSETTSYDFEKIPSKKKITISDSTAIEEKKSIPKKSPMPLETPQLANAEGKQNNAKFCKQQDSEQQSKTNDNLMSNECQNNLHENNIIRDINKETVDSKPSSNDNNQDRPLLHTKNNIASSSANSTAYVATDENKNKGAADTTNINVRSDFTILGENATDKLTNSSMLDLNTNEKQPTAGKNDGTACVEDNKSGIVQDNKNNGLTNNIITHDNYKGKQPSGIIILDIENVMLVDNKNKKSEENKEQICKIENVSELAQNETDDKNIEPTNREVSIHNITTDSLDVKLSNKNIEKESKHSVNLNQDKNKESLRKELSNKDNKELPDNRVLNDDRNKVSTDIEVSTKAETEITTENKNVSELAQNETDVKNVEPTNREVSIHNITTDSLDVKLSNKNIEKESKHSVNLNQDKNKESLRKELSNKDNKELPDNRVLNDDRNKVSTDIEVSTKAETEITTENKNVSELAQNETDVKNVEPTNREVSIHNITTDSLDVKLSNKNIEKESKHSVNLNQDKNKESPRKELSNKDNEELPDTRVLNDDRNKVSTDIQVSTKAETEITTENKKSNEDERKELTKDFSESNSKEECVAENSKKSKQ